MKIYGMMGSFLRGRCLFQGSALMVSEVDHLWSFFQNVDLKSFESAIIFAVFTWMFAKSGYLINLNNLLRQSFFLNHRSFYNARLMTANQTLNMKCNHSMTNNTFAVPLGFQSFPSTSNHRISRPFRSSHLLEG